MNIIEDPSFSSGEPTNASQHLTMTIFTTTLHVAPTKEELPGILNDAIVSIGMQALHDRGVFTVALSGGSLPSFLAELQQSLDKKGVADAHFDKWHIILADERCVPLTDEDSNMKCLQDLLFSQLPGIPQSQIHAIQEAKLAESTDAVAIDYEVKVRKVLELSGGLLDVAVLGFGPDGHTCSLFPNHALLQETIRWVAPITDSPKPPPNRITLTFPVLNQQTRHVVICGAGSSKQPIVQEVMDWAATEGKKTLSATSWTMPLADPAPFPCSMVRPMTTTSSETIAPLTWVIDAEAMPPNAKL
jgi:6-phosphogluconolactonase